MNSTSARSHPRKVPRVLDTDIERLHKCTKEVGKAMLLSLQTMPSLVADQARECVSQMVQDLQSRHDSRLHEVEKGVLDIQTALKGIQHSLNAHIDIMQKFVHLLYGQYLQADFDLANPNPSNGQIPI